MARVASTTAALALTAPPTPSLAPPYPCSLDARSWTQQVAVKWWLKNAWPSPLSSRHLALLGPQSSLWLYEAALPVCSGLAACPWCLVVALVLLH